MRTQRRFWSVTATLVVGLVAIALLVFGRDDPADAATRPATAAELAVPDKTLQVLSEEVGLRVDRVDAAKISTTIAQDAALSIAGSQYADQLPKGASPTLYLVQVADTSQNKGAGLSTGALEWVVLYSDLNITVPGPIAENGKPADSATIRTAILLVDASSGEINLTHWTSSAGK